MQKKCPKCGHNRFLAHGHAVQLWKMDENGEFLNTVNDCVDVAHYPSDDDIWTCDKCGYEGEGRTFDYEDEEDKKDPK